MVRGTKRSQPVGGRKLSWAVVALLTVATAGTAWARLTLGSHSLPAGPAAPRAQPLLNPTPLNRGLGSWGFVSGVGGVAFGAVATPDGIRSVVGLRYDASRPDGARLLLTVLRADGKKLEVHAPIPDWQLLPIARYAATPNEAAFTLFGSLVDEAETKRRRARGEMIANYHPAFENTLLGLRLFQADILILQPMAADLPQEDGKYLLGLGEALPDVQRNEQAFASVSQYAHSLPGNPFQSYVVSDYGVTVTFRVKDRELVLTGDPHWYCWKSRHPERARHDQMNKAANEHAQAVRSAEYDRDRQQLPAGEFNRKYTDSYQRERHAELVDEYFSKNMLLSMPEYSRKLSARIRDSDGVNPAVYDSLRRTLRYAALFRYLKQKDAAMYEAFVNSLKDRKPTPEVETPTVFVPPGRS